MLLIIKRQSRELPTSRGITVAVRGICNIFKSIITAEHSHMSGADQVGPGGPGSLLKRQIDKRGKWWCKFWSYSPLEIEKIDKNPKPWNGLLYLWLNRVNNPFLLHCRQYTDIRNNTILAINYPIIFDTNLLLYGSDVLTDSQNKQVFLQVQKYIL